VKILSMSVAVFYHAFARRQDVENGQNALNPTIFLKVKE